MLVSFTLGGTRLGTHDRSCGSQKSLHIDWRLSKYGRTGHLSTIAGSQSWLVDLKSETAKISLVYRWD